MARVTDRWESRRDTWTFAGCMLLSAMALLMPPRWGVAVATTLRTTALAPFVWLQERAAEGRTSRTRFRAVAAERDSLAELSRALTGLLDENAQLRSILNLSVRTGPGFIPAEVLHQTLPTDGRTLLLDAGRADGVAPLDAVVTPEGLIGAIRDVDEHTSIAMTWAHPEFRVSVVSANGQVAGIVGPTSTGEAGRTSLEFRAITYRDTLPDGALVTASGLGGVYPRGIPVGTVLGVEREQLGWERIYRLRPAAQPGAAGHVLILHGAIPLRIPAAFARGGGFGRCRWNAVPAVPAAPATRGRYRQGCPMTSAKAANRLQLTAAMGVLLFLQFYVRPRLFDGRYAPDFMMIGLVLLALRSGPGVGALAGFLVGLASDALTPARFGAAALANTMVGYLAAQTRAFFFADNLLVNAGFLFGAVWLRDLIVLVASGSAEQGLAASLLIDAPLQALTTALAGTILLVLFGGWFRIRLDQQ